MKKTLLAIGKGLLVVAGAAAIVAGGLWAAKEYGDTGEEAADAASTETDATESPATETAAE